ncbi:MAG: DUF3455 domain-containing protein [Terriglobales bacterium]|jgi:hypothetical protein
MRSSRLVRFTQVVAAFSILGLSLLLTQSSAHAQKISPPKVPDAIQAHPGEQIVLVAHASGSQIYACRFGADGKFSWTLKAPDAELKDGDGKVIGSHFAGPAWKLSDGSQVTGKAAAHVDSDDPSSIQWLRVDVVSHSGEGALSKVTTIQRVNTHGGKPSAGGCDESHRDAETKSSYTADYYFYAPAQ